MLTIGTLECSLDDVDGVGGVADYVLARADRPAAFARGEYYTADGDVDSDTPTVWHGSPAALGQI
ncbi:MAG: hypothetical protein QOJ29_4402, partial [Thermoleophilaceae bacterium]|nr:hypothetical protein [Thermoleophilaceae bacterium]